MSERPRSALSEFGWRHCLAMVECSLCVQAESTRFGGTHSSDPLTALLARRPRSPESRPASRPATGPRPSGSSRPTTTPRADGISTWCSLGFTSTGPIPNLPPAPGHRRCVAQPRALTVLHTLVAPGRCPVWGGDPAFTGCEEEVPEPAHLIKTWTGKQSCGVVPKRTVWLRMRVSLVWHEAVVREYPTQCRS